MMIVSALLLAIPLFPFWKVLKIIREKHQDIWLQYGPFDLGNLFSTTEIQRNFFKVINKGGTDDKLKGNDPELATWLRICREVSNMAPRSFIRQVAYFLIYMFFVGTFTGTIVGWLE